MVTYTELRIYMHNIQIYMELNIQFVGSILDGVFFRNNTLATCRLVALNRTISSDIIELSAINMCRYDY